MKGFGISAVGRVCFLALGFAVPGHAQPMTAGARVSVPPGLPAATAAPAKPMPAAHAASHGTSTKLRIAIADLGPLAGDAPPPPSLIRANPGKTQPGAAQLAGREANATGFQPAPLPNQDKDAPPRAAAGAQLGPALLSRKAEFQGHGFANNSSQDHGIYEREQPAAGLKISLPVIQ